MENRNTKVSAFVIHNGNQRYLKLMLNQLKMTSNNSNIYLLNGDGKAPVSDITCEDMRKYMRSAMEFEKIYHHKSSNPYSFELLCIQRWFILRDFIKINNIIGPFVHIDSDVLMYTDVNKLYEIYQPFDVTVCMKVCPSTMLYSNIDILDSLCEYITQYYEEGVDDTKLKRLCEEDFLKGIMIGGISDMTLIGMWIKDKHIRSVELTEIWRNGCCCGNLICSNGLAMKKKIKEIVWKGTIPFCLEEKTRKFVRMHCFHFQGASKWIMHRYYTGKDLSLFIYILSELRYFRFKLANMLMVITLKLKIKDIIKRIFPQSSKLLKP